MLLFFVLNVNSVTHEALGLLFTSYLQREVTLHTVSPGCLQQLISVSLNTRHREHYAPLLKAKRSFVRGGSENLNWMKELWFLDVSFVPHLSSISVFFSFFLFGEDNHFFFRNMNLHLFWINVSFWINVLYPSESILFLGMIMWRKWFLFFSVCI